jgi:hypothetical protein
MYRRVFQAIPDWKPEYFSLQRPNRPSDLSRFYSPTVKGGACQPANKEHAPIDSGPQELASEDEASSDREATRNSHGFGNEKIRVSCLHPAAATVMSSSTAVLELSYEPSQESLGFRNLINTETVPFYTL